MGADTFTPTDTDRRIARNALMMHLEATDIAKNHESLAAALDDLNMWEFIDNQVECTACRMANIRFLDNIMNRKLHESAEKG